MMIRRLYSTLIRLHPRSFRERFGREMITVFDDHGGARSGPLLIDAVVSLFRQWTHRPAAPTTVSLVAENLVAQRPVFHVLDDRPPRRDALMHGAALSLVLLGGLTFAIGRGGNPPKLLIGAKYPRPHVLPVDRASLSNSEATTEIKVPSPAIDPLYGLANLYFGITRVLGILDADRDRILSSWEIIAAPVVLARLDQNQDGKLSPEECGFSIGERPKPKPDPQLVERARMNFMRLNPALAVLDADHNTAISAAEITNSATALRTLDTNRDGSLTAVEVLPGPDLNP